MTPLIDLLHQLTDWMLSLAESEWAIALLLIITFSESVIFPIPPDPLLIAIGIANPSAAIWVAALTAIASVAGAILGRWLGRMIGRPLLHKLVPQDKTARAETLFSKYGAWAILIAAFTPIPYKVFTILAGIMNLDLKPFILASLIGRSARFLTIGALIFIFGESIRDFIDHNFELLTIATAVTLILLAAAYLIARRLPLFNPQ